MIRPRFLKAAAVMMALGWIMQSLALGLDQPKPNVIIIFIDDLGYGDLGCFGCPDIPTPNIDSLAAEGVKCTSSYVANVACSPSRCSLITGMYAQRFGKYSQMRGLAIPKDHPTLAELMRDAGYVTGQIGKWDIGSKMQGPLERGFMQVARTAPRVDGKHYWYVKEDGTEGFQIDQDGDFLVEFVENNHDKPFFLYYSPRALHEPSHDSPEHYRVRSSATGKRRELAGNLVALDDAIGRLLAALKKQGLTKSTLILLTGDNGGNPIVNARSDPYRGGKRSGSRYEGYVREPTIACWPSVLPKGKTYHGIMASFDFYTTAAAVAGKEPPERCDGVNLIPYLTGQKQGDAHNEIFWCQMSPKATKPSFKAMRWKQWRLAGYQNKWHLFDIEADPREEHDLAAAKPEIVQDMEKRWETWRSTLGPIGTVNSSGGKQPKGYGWATPKDLAVK
jgi:arylsulfatase A-like enzyme